MDDFTSTALIMELQEENKRLQTKIETLRKKLEDSREICKYLYDKLSED